MTAAGGVRGGRDWRAAAPILECLAACKDWPPSVSTIKSILGGSWRPTGAWLQRAQVADQVREALPQIERLRQASGAGTYHDAILSEILDALTAADYVKRVRVDSKNEQHYSRTYHAIRRHPPRLRPITPIPQPHLLQHHAPPNYRYDVYVLTQSGWRGREQQEVKLAPMPLLKAVLDPRAAADAQEVMSATVRTLCAEAAMVTEDEPWKPAAAWKFSVDKRGREGGAPVWESTYKRWATGTTVMEIAASTSTKPLKSETVRGHIVQAFMRGHPVNIARLATESQWALPNWGEWAAIETAAASKGVDPQMVDVPTKDLMMMVTEGWARSDGDGPAAASTRVKRCYACINWWTTLKRVGYTPVFAGAAGDEGRAKRSKTGHAPQDWPKGNEAA